MSNFTCQICKADIIEGVDGYYVSGCEHYPIEVSNLARKSPLLLIADVLAGKHEGTITGDEIRKIFADKF